MDLIVFHAWMLNVRCACRPVAKLFSRQYGRGDVVLDVGSGSGVPAMFACQAGVRLRLKRNDLSHFFLKQTEGDPYAATSLDSYPDPLPVHLFPGLRLA